MSNVDAVVESILTQIGFRMEHYAVCIKCGKKFLVNDEEGMEVAANHKCAGSGK